MNYLTEDEQYKRDITVKEIDMIKDPKLKEIRLRYSKKRRSCFEKTSTIGNPDLEEYYNRLKDQEEREIEKYRIGLTKK